MIIKIISLIFTTLYVRNYFGSGSMDARRIFCKWGQVLNKFQRKRKRSPPPLEKIAPKKEKKGLSHEEKTPVRRKKCTTHKFFGIFNGGDRAPLLAPLS